MSTHHAQEIVYDFFERSFEFFCIFSLNVHKETLFLKDLHISLNNDSQPKEHKRDSWLENGQMNYKVRIKKLNASIHVLCNSHKS